MATAKELKDDGNECFKKQDYEKAIDYYTQAIQLEPNDHVLYSNRSACYINTNKPQLALQDANKCISSNPSWWKGYHKKGLSEFALNKLDEALESYKKGLEYDKDNQTIKSSIIEVEQRQKEENNPFAKNFHKLYTDPKTSKYMSDPQFVNLLQMVMKDPNMLSQMISKDPRFMDVFGVLMGIDLTKMGEEQAKKKKEDEANDKERKKADEERKILEEKQRKEKEEQDRVNSLSNEEREKDRVRKEAEKVKLQGNEEFKKKNFDEALKLYTQANQLNPEELTYYLNLAGCYHELKDFSKVIKNCEHVVENTNDFVKKGKAFGRMAFAHQEMGDIDKAIEYFEKSLLENNDKTIKDYHKEALKIKKKLDDEKFINPEIAEEHNVKANEFFKAGKFADAIKEYSDAIKRNPKNAKYYNNRAAARIKVVDVAHAIYDCEEALKLEPTSLKAFQRLGNCQTLLKKYHRAIEAYENGLKHHPDDKELKEGLQKVTILVRFGDGTSDEERMKNAMQDPEIAELVKHPRIQQLFKDFKENPKQAQEAVQKDQWIQSAFTKLVQAGIIKTG